MRFMLARRFQSHLQSVEPKKLTSCPTANPPHPACIAPPGHRHYPVEIKRRLPAYKDEKSIVEVLRNTFTSLPHWHEYRPYPIETDILIIGGGLVGSAIAYFISKRSPQTKVVVVERDHTYAQAGSVCPGFAGFRTQFSLDENVELTISTINMLRDELPFELCRNHIPKMHVPFHHQPYLILYRDERIAAEQENAVTMQNQLGAYVSMLGPGQINLEYPWLRSDDLLMASCGEQNEGWIDPYDLLAVLRTRATGHGSQFIQGYLVGFDTEDVIGPHEYLNLKNVLVVDGQMNLRPIQFCTIIIAAGSESALIAAKCGLGTEPDYEAMSHPLPITPYQRKIFIIRGVNLPFNCSMVVDPSGVMFTRPDGWPEGYIMAVEALPSRGYKKPERGGVEKNEPFQRMVQILSNRIVNCCPQQLELISTRTANVDINYFDGNWILGRHPYMNRLYFACGSSGSGVQHCLAIGRAMAELQLYRSFRTLDLNSFSFERLASNKPLMEMIVV